MATCANGHKVTDESPGLPIENRRPCPQCGTKDRQLNLHLDEELKTLDDPYNTVVEDSAQGRKVEEACRLYFQRKFTSRNPGNLGYEEILEKIKQDLPNELIRDLSEMTKVTDNLAHGNGYGAMNQFKKLCTRKEYVLPANDIVKGSDIYSFKDIQNLVQKARSGELAPAEITKESDMFEGNLVWTRTCREIYLKLCRQLYQLISEKIQSLP